MSAPSAHNIMPVTKDQDALRLSPVVLSYLQTISTGKRPLSAAQAKEVSQDPHNGKFLQYMSSPASDASEPVGQIDLTRPISNYFINSSHNTYLTGNQLYSESSAASYTTALLRGCRCIEIDVWDGEPRSRSADPQGRQPEEKKHGFRSHIASIVSSHKKSHEEHEQATTAATPPAEVPLQMPTPWTSTSTETQAEPRVLHGYTLTKEIPFRNVCSAIMDAAFVNSDLPIIISLEVHAGAQQQEVMVQIIKSAFKNHLVSLPTTDNLSLPSPEFLLKKILIKVKYVDPKRAVAKAEQPEASLKVPHLSRKTSASSVASSSLSSSDNDTSNAKTEKKKKRKQPSIIPALSELGIYTRSYHFSSLSSPDALVPTHVFSLSEKKLMEVHQSSGPTLFSHNKNFLMRAFPSGLRVRSDNLDPSVFWRKGVQIVALNWQRWDEGMMLNEAMFNGSAGWVLKPEGYIGSLGLRGLGQDSGPKAGEIRSIGQESQADAIDRRTLSLCVTVLAAQDLPLPPELRHAHSFHPYLKIELHVEKSSERDGAAIEKDGKSKDSDDEDNNYKHTLKPGGKGHTEMDFGAVRIEFKEVSGVVEELSFLRFKVQNDEFGKDSLAAWSCIRLDRLKQGYRLIRLLDAEGKPGTGALLVGINKVLT